MPRPYATCTVREVFAALGSVVTAALQNAVGGNPANAVRTGPVAVSLPGEPVSRACYIIGWQLGTVLLDFVARGLQPHRNSTGASNGTTACGARQSGPAGVGLSGTSGLPASRVGGGGRGPSGLNNPPATAPNGGLLAPGIPTTDASSEILQTGTDDPFPRPAGRGALEEHHGLFGSGVSRAPGGVRLLPSDLVQELGPRGRGAFGNRIEGVPP
jgi:hypothetical protein